MLRRLSEPAKVPERSSWCTTVAAFNYGGRWRSFGAVKENAEAFAIYADDLKFRDLVWRVHIITSAGFKTKPPSEQYSRDGFAGEPGRP